MMRFKSDSQRRAVMASLFSRDNSFAKRQPSKLEMFTDDGGRLMVSAENIPTTSFRLATDIDPIEAKKYIGQLDEESLAGVKSVSLVRPTVMKAYDVVSGYYTGEEERVPFGRVGIPKILVESERRGRRSDTFISGLAKDTARAAFQNMYTESGRHDEYGSAIESEYPRDLLEEVYLMQVYDDYRPSSDMMERIEPLRQDLDDEVWRVRSLWRLGNPDVFEARAWRMGKKPRVGVETFVDVPKRKYEKRKSGSIIEPSKEDDKEKTTDDMYTDLYAESKPEQIKEESWLQDSDISFKTTADMILRGTFEIITRLPDHYLENMIEYTTGHWNPAYGVIRERLLAEKKRRESGGV